MNMRFPSQKNNVIAYSSERGEARNIHEKSITGLAKKTPLLDLAYLIAVFWCIHRAARLHCADSPGYFYPAQTPSTSGRFSASSPGECAVRRKYPATVRLWTRTV